MILLVLFCHAISFLYVPILFLYTYYVQIFGFLGKFLLIRLLDTSLPINCVCATFPNLLSTEICTNNIWHSNYIYFHIFDDFSGVYVLLVFSVEVKDLRQGRERTI